MLIPKRAVLGVKGQARLCVVGLMEEQGRGPFPRSKAATDTAETRTSTFRTQRDEERCIFMKIAT